MQARIEDLLQLASGEDAIERGHAAEELGEIGGPAAQDALARLLQDADVVVRFKAAVELGWMGDARGLSALTWGLDRRELCFVALQAIAGLGSGLALPALQRFFDRWFLHPLEKLQAAAALDRCGDARGHSFIRGHLHSSRAEERGFALELWGRLQAEGALELLLQVLSDPHDAQRLDAARGLGHLGDARALPALDRAGVDPADQELAEVARDAARAIRAGA